MHTKFQLDISFRLEMKKSLPEMYSEKYRQGLTISRYFAIER